MEISPDDLTISHRYKLLTGAIVPRPIAVVSTISEDGKHNVAPFSYFSIASHDPMALSVCITGTKPDRSAKDTLVNIKATGQFVVSIATERFASEMVRTSAPLAKGESEFIHAGLTAGTAKRVAAPRIVESPVCFECELLQVIPVGTANLVLGKVLHIFVKMDCWIPGFAWTSTNSRRLAVSRAQAIAEYGIVCNSQMRDSFPATAEEQSIQKSFP